MIGTRLAHFEITAKLGEGGMGEVYRATDTKLDREVAIKVLPEAFVADPDRMARFEREAKVLASLSHPNIAGIFEVGEAEPEGLPRPRPETAVPTQDPGSATSTAIVHYLVMELAEGETLARRLDTRGAIPVEEAVSYAIQMAEGMESAHARGIVHRDLKPANVVITPEGQVKILDFGLARAVEPEGSPSGPDLAHSPTLTYQATQAGFLMGTAAYMSPEQAAGKPADARADVWAFGVVLLEMLTGRRTFEGETVTHVIASVLKDEPDWDAALTGVPARLADVVRRCLRKDPRRRLQAIGEARVRLEEWQSAPTETPTTGLPAADEPDARPTRSRIPWSVVAIVGLVALSILGIVWISGRGQEPVAEELRLALALPDGTRLALGDQYDVIALSPDGKRQAMVVVDEDGRSMLALRDFTRAEPRTAEGTENATGPFFSPDGTWVGLFKDDALYKLPFEGGPPIQLASLVGGNNRGATWSPDGHIYAARDTNRGLERVGENGGDWEPVTQLDPERKERTHRWPRVVPGGEAIVFTSDTEESSEYYDDARIEAVRLATGERTVLVNQTSRAQVLPGGPLVYARGGVLFAVPFDVQKLAVTGPPQVVFQGVATTEASGAAHFSLSDTGDLLYIPGRVAETNRSPQWLDVGTRTLTTTELRPGQTYQVSLAPDDRRVAMTMQTGQSLDIWVGDLQRGTSTRLTFEGGSAGPIWSADGLWVYYYVSPGGLGNLSGRMFRRRSDGTGNPEPFWPDVEGAPLDVTADGRWLLVDRFDRGTDRDDLWIFDLRGEEEARPFLQTEDAGEWMAEISPDGRFVAFTSDLSGRPEVYVQPFSDARGGRWQISVTGGFEPRWAPDGSALYYRWGGTLYRVPVETADGFRAQRAEEVLPAGVLGGNNAFTYSVASDGRLLLLGQKEETMTDRVHLIRGWGREVAAKLGSR